MNRVNRDLYNSSNEITFMKVWINTIVLLYQIPEYPMRVCVSEKYGCKPVLR